MRFNLKQLFFVTSVIAVISFISRRPLAHIFASDAHPAWTLFYYHWAWLLGFEVTYPNFNELPTMDNNLCVLALFASIILHVILLTMAIVYFFVIYKKLGIKDE